MRREFERDLQPGATKKKKRTCRLDDCERWLWRDGYCNPHWKRLVSKEIPADLPIKLMDSNRGCAYPGCARKHRTGNYCAAHYTQMLYNGECKPIIIRTKREQWGLDEDSPSYMGAHIRARITWGSASQYPCIECAKQAKHWAYDGTDPTQLYGPSNPWDPQSSTWTFYSRYPEFYMPMCAKCHRSMDGLKMQRELREYRTFKARTGQTLSEFQLSPTEVESGEPMDPEVVLATLGYRTNLN